MGISISNIMQHSAAFKKSQMASFKKFVNTSKQLKSAALSEQQLIKQDWQTMLEVLQELREPTTPNDESPIQILLNDPEYVAALTEIVELKPGFNNSGHAKEYITAFQKAVWDYMKQRNNSDG